MPQVAHAQTSTLSFPVQIPAPAPLTVAVPAGTTLTVGGVSYAVSGTLTLTPTTAMVVTGSISFKGYRDASRNPITTIAAGAVVAIEGSGFGAQAGTLTVGGLTDTASSWSDAEIIAQVPNAPSASVAVVVNGVTDTYPLTITPQVALLPGTAPGDIPPSDWPPFVADFQVGGLHVETCSVGDDLALVGQNFGDAGGVVWIGNDRVPAAAWSDMLIHLSPIAPAPGGSVFTIERNGGALGSAFGPIIAPKAG